MIKEKDDILVVYELLIIDLAMVHKDINVEEFKALAQKYNVSSDAAIVKHISSIAE